MTASGSQPPANQPATALRDYLTDARILDPMAELIVDDEDLVVHLTLGEKIWGFHGDIRVRLEDRCRGGDRPLGAGQVAPRPG